MDAEEKDNTEDECVNNAIWETMEETLNLVMYDDNSNASSNSSIGLEIDINEPIASTSSPKKNRKRKAVESIPKDLERMENEIQEQLDCKAKKSKLTVVNVKNMLKHVITNKHVMAMVRQSMRESGDVGSSDEEFPFEPKLTRAKTKELQTKFPWPMTPTKATPASGTKKLIEAELPEDEEDDEEYQPVEEEDVSEDENTSMASDLEPLTPQSVTPNKSTDCSTQTAWTDDGLFRLPLTQETEPESIVHRTRSKLCLSETPLETIEKAFIPPDITTDMYDYEYDNEDYIKFLEEFTQPLNSVVNDTVDDEEDPEYNILEDEEAEDKEELRADRAVKVPKKEVNELIAELLEFLEPDDDDDFDNGNNTDITLPECSFSALQEQRESSQSMFMMSQSSLIQQSPSSRFSPSHTAFLQTPPPPIRPCISNSPLHNRSPVLQNTNQSDKSPQLNFQMSPVRTPIVNYHLSPIPMRSPLVHLQSPAIPMKSPVNLSQGSPLQARTLVTPVQPGNDDGIFILPDHVVHVQNISTGVVEMSREQRSLLAQQMRQHVQLLATSYMQSSVIPEMHCCAIETKDNLLSLKFLNGTKTNSAFFASNLEDAVQAVNEWDAILSKDNPKSQELKRFTEEQKQLQIEKKKKKKLFEAVHNPIFLEAVSCSKAFVYPLMLPARPFSSRCNVTRVLKFTDSENILLVFGLEQFLPYIEKNEDLHSKRKIVTMKKASDLISEFILAAKTSKSIETHIAVNKNVQSHVISNPGNLVLGVLTSVKTYIYVQYIFTPLFYLSRGVHLSLKQFFHKNKVPLTQHFVIDVKCLAPCEQPKQLLPEIWRKFIYKEN